MKNIIFSVIVLFAIVSCIENRELPYGSLIAEPGYFIECYLISGENYKLSATKLQPLYLDYDLDYSLKFDVWIDKLKLTQGIFRDDNSKYIFNYGHFLRFKEKKKKKVKLLVITPENDTIKGSTTMPKEIDILNAAYAKNHISFDFVLSNEEWHNYYMINVNKEYPDTIHRTIRFLDYSHLSTQDTVNFEHQITKDEQPIKIDAILRRVTKENYDYQISLENAKDSNRDNLILPSPLAGNLENSTGIFTCYTTDSVIWHNKQ